MRPSWFALSLTLTPLLACTNDEKPTALPAASASSQTAAPNSAAPAVASAAPVGPLDYRGTLGKKTGIAMHLAANGHAVKGSYVYTSLGRPIPLAGTVEPSGAYTLNESVKGKVTGTFHLTASGADLVGDWQAPGGANGFPVHLSPGAPWTPVVPDAGGGGRWRQAEACLSDPACLAVDAARWFVEGDDAHEAGVDCYRFLDGDGAAKDAKRGRACLERSVGERACEKGSSAGLEGAELAALLIDGVGGAEDVPRARALFADCVEDATTTWVRGRADAKTHDPKTAHLGICDAHEGTTLVSNDCGSRDLTRMQTRVHLAEKAGAATHDVIDFSGEQAEKVKALTRKYGVSLSALGYYPNPLCADEKEAGVYIAHLQKVIRASATLGLNLVNTFVGRDHTRSLADNWSVFDERWPEIVRFAESCGVRIAIENCPMLFSNDEWPGGKNMAVSPKIWREMFNRIPSSNFGLNYDPSHLVWQFMDPVRPLAEFRERIFHVHAKDLKIWPDRLDDAGILDFGWNSPKLPGLGDVHWPDFFATLTHLRYQGAICIEVEDAAYESSLDDRKRALAQSKRFLQNYL